MEDQTAWWLLLARFSQARDARRSSCPRGRPTVAIIDHWHCHSACPLFPPSIPGPSRNISLLVILTTFRRRRTMPATRRRTCKDVRQKSQFGAFMFASVQNAPSARPRRLRQRGVGGCCVLCGTLLRGNPGTSGDARVT